MSRLLGRAALVPHAGVFSLEKLQLAKKYIVGDDGISAEVTKGVDIEDFILRF